MNNPMVAQTLQGAVLSATSNILAQAITAYKDGTTFALQLEPIKRFVIFSILSNPPNIVWQDFLEKAFPTAVAAPKRPSSEKSPAKTVTSKTNILIKFLLDQSVGAAVNTWMFLAFMAYVNASQQVKVSAWDLILKDCKERTWPMMKDGYKFWPIISLISFMWVPVDKRVVFGCSAGVLWGIYLSLAVDA